MAAMDNLLVAHLVYNLYGGVASVAASIMNELYRKGIRSVLVYTYDDSAMTSMLEFTPDRLQIQLKTCPGYTILHGFGIRKVYEKLCQDYPDNTVVIHAHNLQTVGALEDLHEIPLVCTLHGFGNIGMGFRSRVSDKICRIAIHNIFKAGGTVTAVSSAVAQFYDPYRRRIKVIYNGIRAEFKRDKQPLFTVLHLGNISVAKGWNVTCEGFSRIDPATRKNMKFLYAGKPSGYTMQQIYQIIHKFGIENESEYLGFVNNAAENLIPKADVLVLASKTEGFGLVLIEALARGVPVLGTPIEGIKEIIRDGENGYFIQNANDIAKRLCELYQNPEIYQSMSTNARRLYLDHFTAESMTNQYTYIYRQLI